MENVILVDENDNQIGLMEKLEAHRKGLLHRAFSVFLFNDKNEMLLQKRATHKYHSGGLWTNTCCSHPRDKEEVKSACIRRLQEEMGIVCDDKSLQFAFSFTYRAMLDQEMVEHEYDHVYIGKYDAVPQLNPEEVEEYAYKSIEEIDLILKNDPDYFTSWFKIAYPEVKNHLSL